MFLKEYPEEVFMNRPFTIKISIKGPGALEFYAIDFSIDNESIELMSKREEFTFYNYEHGEKIFTYTYLPKKAMDLPSSLISYHYFDPDKRTYFTSTLRKLLRHFFKMINTESIRNYGVYIYAGV